MDFTIAAAAYGIEFHTYLEILDNGPSPTLYYYLGDPDNDNRVVYRRTP